MQDPVGKNYLQQKVLVGEACGSSYRVPGKCKSLSSNLSAAKKQKRKQTLGLDVLVWFHIHIIPAEAGEPPV
jgi:hypothetical protein